VAPTYVLPLFTGRHPCAAGPPSLPGKCALAAPAIASDAATVATPKNHFSSDARAAIRFANGTADMVSAATPSFKELATQVLPRWNSVLHATNGGLV
jgi:hypothetical protein